MVSILTRLEGRVQRGVGLYSYSTLTVSILTRLEGRVQPSYYDSGKRILRCFNPHPARRPGATSWGAGLQHPILVSILTRLEGRVQHLLRAKLLRLGEFQSSPGSKAGCNFVTETKQHKRKEFQSSPGSKAGCNPALVKPSMQSMIGFNPHPARRPGATTISRLNSLRLIVSILTRLEGRVQR